MTKFRVPIKIEFDGSVLVDADNEEKAEMIACLNMRGTLTAYQTGVNSILKYEVNSYGYAKRRDNESIEELEN